MPHHQVMITQLHQFFHIHRPQWRSLLHIIKHMRNILHHMFFRKLLWLSHFPSAKILFSGKNSIFRLTDDFLNTLYFVRKSWVPWETLDHCYYYTLLRTKAYKGTPTLLLLQAEATKKSRSSCLTIFNIIRWVAESMGQTTHRPSVWCSKHYFFS